MNIEKEELIRRLKIAEPYNNKDVPQYVWSIINAIPDAERKGHWIDTGSGQECSICHEIQYGYDTGRHYCANCGCKIEGE